MDRNKDMRLQIVMKQVSDIASYASNPRRNERTALKVKQSIEQFGFKNPILIDENNVIVSGHARHKAAMMLGMQEVPCVYVSGLTPEKVRAFRIADNKTAEIAGWDFDKLCQEMVSLSDAGFDLDLSGFNEAEQIYYANPDAKPGKVDKGEFKDEEQFAEDHIIQSYNVAIVCADESEKEYIMGLFGERKHLKRLYRAEELIKMARATA